MDETHYIYYDTQETKVKRFDKDAWSIGDYRATLEWLKRKMARRRKNGDLIETDRRRDVISNHIGNGYGEVASILYVLSGSPPKRYALFQEPELTVYGRNLDDVEKKFVGLKEIDNLSDHLEYLIQKSTDIEVQYKEEIEEWYLHNVALKNTNRDRILITIEEANKIAEKIAQNSIQGHITEETKKRLKMI